MSNKPIEVGCRVMVVKDYIFPKNIGKMAIVIDVASEDDWFLEEAEEVCLVIESLGTDFTALEGPSGFAYAIQSKEACYEDTCLIRLDDDIDEENECDEISKVKETV